MSWNHRKSFINIPQILLDAFCLILIYGLAVMLIGELFRPVSMTEYLWVLILFGMVYLFMMYTSEMYHRTTFTYQDRTLRYVLKACFSASLLCLVMMPFASTGITGYDFLMLFLLAALVVLCTQYLIVQELRLSSQSKWRKRAVLVGYSENIQEYLYYIKKTSFQVETAGYVLLDRKPGAGDKRDSDPVDELVSILRKNVVDEIIFAVPGSQFEEIRPLIAKCRERGLTIRITMDLMNSYDTRSTVHWVGTIPVFTLQQAGLNDFQSFVKRTMDIIGALLGLAFLAVASVVIVPMIRLQIGGPVFVQRPYISINGRPFTLYWFRTSTGKDAPVPLIGRILKSTGLDHLPMFWNVLKGDMSLVGSVPVPAVDLDLLTNEQFRNFCIRPGLTGTWRFVENDRKNDERYLTELNMEYVNKWSLSRDLWLLFKTMIVVLARKSNLRLLDRLDQNQSAEFGYYL